MLNKAIEHNKEKREPYRGSKAFSYRCRNHGGCTTCLSNRTHKYVKTSLKMLDKYNEYMYNKDR